MSGHGRLAGKIAFITGTAGGQGRVAAQLFAAEGAHVVGCGHSNAAGAAETAELVHAAGGTMTSFDSVDLSTPDGARAWIEDGVARAGGIDILYNNAGSVRFGFVPEITPDDWGFTLRNELDIIFWTVQAAWPHLIERGGGSIVNISAGAATVGLASMGLGAHAAAKGGVVSLTRQLAAEGGRHLIRVNSICPGAIETPALRAALAAGQLPAMPLPLGRIGLPEDVALCALFLASDEAGWITAADIAVDGGMTVIDGVEPTVV
jgi:meso-butanediol dehydrogenase/(S,S)-butanediol dehydrogenase/diacetyl reductase